MAVVRVKSLLDRNREEREKRANKKEVGEANQRDAQQRNIKMNRLAVQQRTLVLLHILSLALRSQCRDRVLPLQRSVGIYILGRRQERRPSCVLRGCLSRQTQGETQTDTVKEMSSLSLYEAAPAIVCVCGWVAPCAHMHLHILSASLIAIAQIFKFFS